MELGLFLALLSAVCFALSSIFIRRGAYRAGEAFTSVVITVLFGLVFFAIVTFVAGEWGTLWSVSWRVWAQLGAAGIIHFILGRRLGYAAYRIIGVNRASAIVKSQVLYPVVLGIVLLGEPLTVLLIPGVLLIGIGATLVSIEKGESIPKDSISKASAGKGILAAVLGAVFWGISGVLIKPMVVQTGAPYAALFISYIAASLVVAGLMLGKGMREQVGRLNRSMVVPIIIGGFCVGMAHLLRYIALVHSPVSVVTPLMETSSVFVLLFSFLLNRNIEVFTWKVYLGIALTTSGAILFFV